MRLPLAPPFVALLMLAGCAAEREPPPPSSAAAAGGSASAPMTPAPAPAPASAPAPATAAIVGSGSFLGPQSVEAGRRPLLIDAWLQAAGVPRDDPAIAFDVTGNSSGIAVACKLEPQRQKDFLRRALQGMQASDPLYEPMRYFLDQHDRLQGATFTLLTRLASGRELRVCEDNGVRLRQIVFANIACDQGYCPAVLLVDPAGLDKPPIARRLLQALIGPGGLAYDQARLAAVGVTSLTGPELDTLRATAASILGS
jgi:hypothetical protein